MLPSTHWIGGFLLFRSILAVSSVLFCLAGTAEAALRDRALERSQMEWQKLGRNTYVFAGAGAAFLDANISARERRDGDSHIRFTANESQNTSPAVTAGFGWHMHRYFALEVAYTDIPDAQYKGSIESTDYMLTGKTLDGDFDFTEEVTSQIVAMSLVTNSYDINEAAGISLRLGGLYYDISDTLVLSGSGTVDGNALSASNKTIAIKDNGFSWIAGTSLYFAPTINSRLDIRLDYIDEMDVKSFNTIGVAAAYMGLRYRF